MRPCRGVRAATLILAVFGAGCAARAGGPGAATATPADAPPTGSPPASSDEQDPIVREIVLEGVSVYTPAVVHRAIRLRPGGRLRRPVAELASDLQRRYAVQGYFGARVEGRWEPATGVLTLRADEGRLSEVDVEGVEGAVEERARALLALAPGQVLNEKEVRAGLNRLERGSGGAFRVAGDPPYSVERTGDGVRLKVAARPVRTRVRLRLTGPDPSPTRTRVEGTTPGGGVELTLFDPASLQHARVYALGAYGFTSEQWRFALGAQRPFAGQRLVLGYEFHDLTDTDDVFRRHALGMPAGKPRLFSITEDYFRRRGHEAHAFLRPSPRLHVGLSWRHDRFESLPVLTHDSVFFFKRQARLNPLVDEGARDALLLTGRWSAGAPLYASEVAERDSFLLRDPYGDQLLPGQTVRLDATLEAAGRSDEGGPPYQRLIAHARGQRMLTPLLGVGGRILLGLGRDTPPQRLFGLGGAGTLRGYAAKRFLGEDMVLATAEGRLRPGPRWPDVIGFYDGGVAWTSGLAGAGWRDDLGLGLEWPGGGEGRVRVDTAFALRPPAGESRVRVHASIVLPF